MTLAAIVLRRQKHATYADFVFYWQLKCPDLGSNERESEEKRFAKAYARDRHYEDYEVCDSVRERLSDVHHVFVDTSISSPS